MAESYWNEIDKLDAFEQDGGIRIEREYAVTMSRTKTKQNLKQLQNQVNTLRKQIKSIEDGSYLKDVAKELTQQKKDKQKQYEDFDNQYEILLEELEKEIKERRENKEFYKKEAKKAYEQFDDFAATKMQREMEGLAHQLQLKQGELAENERNAKVYKKALGQK